MNRWGFAGSGLLLGLLALPAAAQGTIRGTVFAPRGADVQGTVVVACFVASGRCDDTSPHSRAVRIDSRGPSAAYAIRDLQAGRYYLVALKDQNRNGREDPEDWTGDHGSGGLVAVRPPAEGIDIQMRGGAMAEPERPAAEGSARARPASPSAPSPAAAPAAPGAGGLHGIYAGMGRDIVAPGPGSPVQYGITSTVGRDWIAFLPDGRVYTGLPHEGLREPLDWPALCRLNPERCTRYQVRGNRVTVRWDSGFERVFTRDADGTLWTEDRINFTALPPLNDLRLDGRYGSVGNEYRTGWIQFRPDGTFNEQGFLYDTDWKEIGSYRDLTEVERAGGSGRYAISHNTLELRYRDGRVVRMSVYAFPDEAARAQPRVLYFNAWDYHRAR